jgi:hypothetical protein
MGLLLHVIEPLVAIESASQLNNQIHLIAWIRFTRKHHLLPRTREVVHGALAFGYDAGRSSQNLGMDSGAISRYERGLREPSLFEILEFSYISGVKSRS